MQPKRPDKERRHARIIRYESKVTKEKGFACPNCKCGWKKKSDVPAECPCCSTIFDGYEDCLMSVYTTSDKKAIKLAKKSETEI